jgi:isopenicillin N synthase-like dioxygenase
MESSHTRTQRFGKYYHGYIIQIIGPDLFHHFGDAFNQQLMIMSDILKSVNYYPPLEQVNVPTDEETEVSIGSHTDFQLFTMLWQDNAGGLQVLNRQGQWINAKPIEGTFVVNIADYMQRITNDL